MTSAKTESSIPESTATEEWRLMSAAIAYELWAHPDRIKQRIESDEPPNAWKSVAPEYRARVRYVLRQLVKEGIIFSEGDVAGKNDRLPQRWWQNSARLAWLLWLRKRRTNYTADETVEQVFWETDSDDYRAYVRGALRALRAKGIHLDH